MCVVTCLVQVSDPGGVVLTWWWWWQYCTYHSHKTRWRWACVSHKEFNKSQFSSANLPQSAQASPISCLPCVLLNLSTIFPSRDSVLSYPPPLISFSSICSHPSQLSFSHQGLLDVLFQTQGFPCILLTSSAVQKAMMVASAQLYIAVQSYRAGCDPNKCIGLCRLHNMISFWGQFFSCFKSINR